MVDKFDLLKHFGVYGVAIDNEKLLVIEKIQVPIKIAMIYLAVRKKLVNQWLTH